MKLILVITSKSTSDRVRASGHLVKNFRQLVGRVLTWVSSG